MSDAEHPTMSEDRSNRTQFLAIFIFPSARHLPICIGSIDTGYQKSKVHRNSILDEHL